MGLLLLYFIKTKNHYFESLKFWGQFRVTAHEMAQKEVTLTIQIKKKINHVKPFQ